MRYYQAMDTLEIFCQFNSEKKKNRSLAVALLGRGFRGLRKNIQLGLWGGGGGERCEPSVGSGAEPRKSLKMMHFKGQNR